MTVIRVHTRVDSETLHLPELRPLVGKNVEIIVREESSSAAAPSAYEAFFALAGQDVVDPDALKTLRAASVL